MAARDPLQHELERCRTRLHKLENERAGTALQFQRLEARVSSLEATRDEWLPPLRDLLEDEKIDAAVAIRLKQRGTVVPIGWVPKLIVLLVGVSAIGSFLLSVVRALHG